MIDTKPGGTAGVFVFDVMSSCPSKAVAGIGAFLREAMSSAPADKEDALCLHISIRFGQMV